MSTEHTPQTDEGYDRQEPMPLAIVAAGIFLLIFVLLSGLGVRAYFIKLSDEEFSGKVAELPTREWDELKASSKARLSSYGFVDQKAGTVHIPLDRAIDLVVALAHAPPAPEAVTPKAKK